jgi:hypothetical protein
MPTTLEEAADAFYAAGNAPPPCSARRRITDGRFTTTLIVSEWWPGGAQPLPVKASSRPAVWESTGSPAGSSSPS